MSLSQSYRGRSRYRSDYVHGLDQLLVAVTCRAEGSADVIPALLDTGAEWCVAAPALAAAFGWSDGERIADATLSTRFGSMEGYLARVSLLLPALEGSDVRVEATCFIAEHWPGPLVIGWKGCLERIRFALDPVDESFYFADL